MFSPSPALGGTLGEISARTRSHKERSPQLANGGDPARELKLMRGPSALTRGCTVSDAVAEPEVELIQLLTPEGERVEHPEYAFAGDDEQIKGFYRDMVLIRRIDTEAIALQRQGELGLWPSLLGQEAAQIGSGRAMLGQDYAFPTYREHGVAWCRGVDPLRLLACSAASTPAPGTRPSTASTCTRSSSAPRPCTPPATRWGSSATAWSAPATPTATPR